MSNPRVQKFNEMVALDLQEAAVSPTELRKWCRGKDTEQLRDALAAMLPHFVAERAVLDEEIDRRQHRETQARLESLKKPHWTVLWTFALVIVGLIVSIAGTVIGWLAWRRPVAPESSNAPIPTANTPAVSSAKSSPQKTPETPQEAQPTTPK